MRVCSLNKHQRGTIQCPHRERGLCPTCYSASDLLDKAYVAEVEACPDCQAAQAAETARIQAEETIDPAYPYGQHLTLTCFHHPHLRWSTKNIGYIGARSIFFTSQGETECDCPAHDLRVVH